MVLIFLIQYNPIKLWGYTHSKVVAFRTCHGSYIYIFAKGFTEQWKSPPAGELLPRVRSLGAAQFVENKKIPSLCLPIVAHPGQRGICGSDCWPMVMVRPKFGWLWLCSPASGYNVVLGWGWGSGFSRLEKVELLYHKRPGTVLPPPLEFFLFYFLKENSTQTIFYLFQTKYLKKRDSPIFKSLTWFVHTSSICYQTKYLISFIRFLMDHFYLQI
jgi:hypothetical protein